MTHVGFLRNQELQRELYGEPLGDRLRRLQGALDITQARLADTLGISPTMLSQLISGRRVKIGNPAVLARLVMLDDRARALGGLSRPAAVDELLAEIRGARPSLAAADWSAARPVVRPTVAAVPDPSPALREVAGPAALTAAAATLSLRFPALADVLRRAAGH